MPEFDDTVAFLAIEEKPNSFYPIDTKELSLANNEECLTLRTVDAFTSMYELEELKNAIQEANIIPDGAISSPLVVVYTDYGIKKKSPVITKDFLEKNNIFNMILENIPDKEFANSLLIEIRKFNLESGLKRDLEAAIKSDCVADVFDIFDNLPYTIQRKFYFCLIKILNKKKNRTRKLTNPKKEGE